ncbi:MAG: hypothetical protein AAF481_19795 [Acidobacteriota bacterium]
MKLRGFLLLLFVVACSRQEHRQEPLTRWQEPTKIGARAARHWVTIRHDAERNVLTETVADALGTVRLRQAARQAPAPSEKERRRAFRRLRRLAALPPEAELAGGFLWTDDPCPPSHRCLEAFRMDPRSGRPTERWLIDLTADRLLGEAP